VLLGYGLAGIAGTLLGSRLVSRSRIGTFVTATAAYGAVLIVLPVSPPLPATASEPERANPPLPRSSYWARSIRGRIKRRPIQAAATPTATPMMVSAKRRMGCCAPFRCRCQADAHRVWPRLAGPAAPA